mmetsp:Transcript_8435/g.23217  ORF Transcript_8435/g.23217 Transcript_8435/m.23217 type:complete len:227 (+) Transcript_8435:1625-2305(+)
MEHVAAVIRQTTRAVPRLAVKVARNVLYDALHFSLLEDDRGKRARRLVEGSHGPHAVLLLIDGVVLDIACEDLRDAPQAAIQASPALAQNFSGHRLSLGAGAEHVQCEVRAVDRAWSRLVVAGTRLVLARLGGHPDERVPEPQALCEASLDVGHEKKEIETQAHHGPRRQGSTSLGRRSLCSGTGTCASLPSAFAPFRLRPRCHPRTHQRAAVGLRGSDSQSCSSP